MRTAEEKKSNPATEMLTSELAGKHNAAQVYDERIWKIRTGFLTLTFASWGALLAVGMQAMQKGAAPLLAITVALAIAGLATEFFYVCRKSRCIKVINEMSIGLYRLLESDETAGEDVELWLRFSGDDDRVSAMDSPMFGRACVESLIIYATPALGFFVAYLLFFIM